VLLLSLGLFRGRRQVVAVGDEMLHQLTVKNGRVDKEKRLC